MNDLGSKARNRRLGEVYILGVTEILVWVCVAQAFFVWHSRLGCGIFCVAQAFPACAGI